VVEYDPSIGANGGYINVSSPSGPATGVAGTSVTFSSMVDLPNGHVLFNGTWDYDPGITPTDITESWRPQIGHDPATQLSIEHLASDPADTFTLWGTQLTGCRRGCRKPTASSRARIIRSSSSPWAATFGTLRRMTGRPPFKTAPFVR